MIQNAAENACFEGARRGIVPGATNSACEAATANILSIAGIRDFTIDVQPQAIDESTDEVTVTAVIPITARNSFGISAFFRGRSIVKEVTMPRQQR